MTAACLLPKSVSRVVYIALVATNNGEPNFILKENRASTTGKYWRRRFGIERQSYVCRRLLW